MDEADFDVSQGGQVEIIGWIYQYYNTDNKEKAISSPKSHKFRDTEIASVTQIFTPDWIVKYMVQNSLGKLWIKSLIEKDDSRTEEEIASTFNWKYYMSEAKQPDNVVIALKNIDEPLKDIKPTDIQMIDPSMGSGHILVYAFDVLMQIYKSEGYSEREASKLIVSNNLHGLDIDTRAFQLSYFAVYMKLRQYNRRALSSNIKLNIYDVPETNETNIDDFEPLFEKLSNDSIDSIRSLVNLFKNGNDLGSLIQTQNIDYLSLTNDLNKVNIDQLSFEIIPLLHQVEMLINVSKLLGSYYHVVITNPPYMGSSRMDLSLSDFSKKYYPNSKSDLFSMFIERWNKSILPGGYNCMVTMQSWMFLSSFEKMRTHLLENYTISNLMHMENNVMGIAFGTAVAVIRNTKIPKFIGTYHQIKTADASNKIPTSVPIPGNRFNRTNQANFSKIPGSPIGYWVQNSIFDLYINYRKVEDIADVKKGSFTGDNNRFLRRWTEVTSNNIGFNIKDASTSVKSQKNGFRIIRVVNTINGLEIGTT
ncbi:BREX-1 system adenine-specific DNA-methyltransferase PglX [Companilactobacillus sp. FL22-3]